MYDVVDKVQLIGLYASAAAAVATIAITSRATRGKGIAVPENFPKDRCANFRKYFDAFSQINGAAAVQKGPIATPATARDHALNAFIASGVSPKPAAPTASKETASPPAAKTPANSSTKAPARSLIKPPTIRIRTEGSSDPPPPRPNLRPKPRK